jgi:glycosyltransferase involved in cell wall biosynthesis
MSCRPLFWMVSNAMRVAHINLARGFRGGERQTQLLVEGLAGRGIRQKLIARKNEPLAKRCEGIDGLEIVAVPGNVFGAASALDSVELVHVHEGRAIQAAFLNQKLRGIPYMVTRRVQRGPRHDPLTRAMYRRAAIVAVLSNAIRESMIALDDELIFDVVPDCSSRLKADAENVRSLRKQFGEGFIVGHIGELDDSHKGQLQIISIAKRLAGKVPGVTFVMVGSGKDSELLEREAKDLPNVIFSGQVNNVGDYLAAFDAFLYPSRHEGFGSILLDALVFGLPIIASNVGGIPELIDDGKNGFLCELDDSDALSEAVLKLNQNPDLRESIGQTNREKSAGYSENQMTRRYIEIYERLVKDHVTEGVAV